MLAYQLDDVLSVQLLQPEDVGDLFALVDASRAHLRPWFPWVDQQASPADSGAFIQEMLAQHARQAGFQCGIHVGTQLAGTVGFDTIDRMHRRAALSYWLGPAFQGHGIMTRCCRVLLAEAFGLWDINRVDIVTAVENVRSRALAARLGFVQEGVLCEYQWLYDHFVDYAVYALLRREWEKIRFV